MFSSIDASELHLTSTREPMSMFSNELARPISSQLSIIERREAREIYRRERSGERQANRRERHKKGERERKETNNRKKERLTDGMKERCER